MTCDDKEKSRDTIQYRIEAALSSYLARITEWEQLNQSLHTDMLNQQERKGIVPTIMGHHFLHLLVFERANRVTNRVKFPGQTEIS